MGKVDKVQFKPEPKADPAAAPAAPVPDKNSLEIPTDAPSAPSVPPAGGPSPSPDPVAVATDRPNAGDPPTQSKPEPKAEAKVDTPSTVSEVAKSTGLSEADVSKYAEEVTSSGQLSEASLAEIESKGIPKALAIQFVEGQQAVAARQRSEVLSAVGGEQTFTEVKTWASTNLSAEDKAAYNKTIQSGDIGAIKLALAGLKSRFESANGSNPTLLSGGRGAAASEPMFTSMYQMVEAMKDPRYEKDSAYRDSVIRRAANL